MDVSSSLFLMMFGIATIFFAFRSKNLFASGKVGAYSKIFLIASGLALLAVGGWLTSKQPKEALTSSGSAPADPTLKLAGQTATSKPLDLQLTFPDSWKFQASKPPVELMARDSKTDAIFTAHMMVYNEMPPTLDALIDDMVKSWQKEWNQAEEIGRGDTHLGSLPARWVAFRIPPRKRWTKEVIAKKGPYLITFACNGEELAHAACQALLDQLVLPSSNNINPK